MKKLILLLPIVLMMLLSGCMHFPTAVKADKESELRAKTFKPNPNTATIYVYKEDIMHSSGLSFSVKIDNQYVGAIVKGTFCSIAVPPGTHTVASTMMLGTEIRSDEVQLELNADAGQNYFFLQDTGIGPGVNLLQSINEASGKQVVSNLAMIAIPENAIQNIAAITKQNQPITVPDNFPLASKLTAPPPISGNSGNYMSPFTTSGGVASWALKVEATTDNGSDLAANLGGAVGERVGQKVLEFVPFGLGGMIGREAGSSAGRATTRQVLQSKVPRIEEVKASSDISFNSAQDLAVYMYAKYSNHREYQRILALTQKIYPEMTRVYVSAIEQAAHTPEKLASGQNKAGFNEPELKDKLEALKELKDKGLISESDYQVKKNKLIDAM